MPADYPVNTSSSGAEIIRQLVAVSPYVAHLGMRLVAIEPGMAVMALPFNEAMITVGKVVHGGAIASLIDTAATVAAWSGAELPAKVRGSTVSMTVTYLAPAEQEDVQATAHVLRRGRSLVYLDVDVQNATGAAVAKGLVTYKLG
jgi:uncharacterized protein (TIGR00369 family)